MKSEWEDACYALNRVAAEKMALLGLFWRHRRVVLAYRAMDGEKGLWEVLVCSCPPLWAVSFWVCAVFNSECTHPCARKGLCSRLSPPYPSAIARCPLQHSPSLH